MMKARMIILGVLIAVGMAACQNTDESLTSTSNALSLKSGEISLSDVAVEAVATESEYEADYFSNAERLLRHVLGKYGDYKHYLQLKGGLRHMENYCPNVMVDTTETGYPITITLDYGDSTVLHNGKVLSGLIEIVITAPRHTDGATRTVTYSDFSVDSVVVNGTVSEAFYGNNVDSCMRVLTEQLSFAFADGVVYERTGERVHRWLEGLDTPLDPSDDRIEITGTLTIVNSDGDSYSKVIVEPLIKLGDCPWVVQGLVQIVYNSEVMSETDYGTGECDNEATLTEGDTVTIIELNANHHSSSDKGKSQGHRNGKGH